MSKPNKEQRAAMRRQEEERVELEKQRFQKDLPHKIVFELIPELHERGIHYQINYGLMNEWEKKKNIMLNVDGNWFNIAELEEWQWNGDILEVIRAYDYDRAVEKERADKKAAALNKLTAEEKEILGVK